MNFGKLFKGYKQINVITDSKNINHKNMKLFDYLELFKTNIINIINSIITLSINNYAQIRIKNQTISNNDTYQPLLLADNILYNRSNSLVIDGKSNFYEIVNNRIKIKYPYEGRLKLVFSCEVQGTTTQSEKFVKINVYRNGQNITPDEFRSITLTNYRGILYLPLYYYSNIDDEIEILIYGKQNDVFKCNILELEITPRANIVPSLYN